MTSTYRLLRQTARIRAGFAVFGGAGVSLEKKERSLGFPDNKLFAVLYVTRKICREADEWDSFLVKLVHKRQTTYSVYQKDIFY